MAYTRITHKRVEEVRKLVRLHNPAYEKETGMGPCGALAVVLSRAGWGKIAFAETTSSSRVNNEGQWYPHYIILRGKRIIDVSGEYIIETQPDPVYREMEVCEERDLLACGPGTLYGNSDIKFWHERLVGVI